MGALSDQWRAPSLKPPPVAHKQAHSAGVAHHSSGRNLAVLFAPHWINPLRAEGHPLLNNVRRQTEEASMQSEAGREALPDNNAAHGDRRPDCGSLQ